MVQKLQNLQETASQTAGPYVHIGLMPTYAGNPGSYEQEIGVSPISEGAKGEIIEIRGQVIDGTGNAIRDAMLESWQPDAAGIFPGQPGADPAVSGLCRFAADADSGEFVLKTVKPGAFKGRGGSHNAPHISLWIVARGINIGLNTRIYFEDEDNADDRILKAVELKHRVPTLIAKKTGDGQYRFDVRLQGDAETVFLDI
ncbi:protocatechuate 3,4-dioxygenase subunit alpha [Martelella radicis]|uniref:Protocatechuate 3,4-dioxygenase alpha subunit n=1 Tax=Martelella radicis TaxID=1397476 RepID=A0A7W6KHD2_9HYPH|nr:protocatechuate 3,4-dioxygenase subunit alpha [Martelella radicis]MBB4121221.1 protocatechuate 3,4-dioxygenase alpha subunit [Martelella radicis]